MSNLAGKVALITGGTAGIGLEVAFALLAEGATVVINGRDPARAAAALERLGSSRATYMKGDAGEPQDMRGMLVRLEATYGKPAILVTSGGAAAHHPKPFEQLADDAFATILRNQFLNRVHPIRAALPHFCETGASIIVIGTDAGRYATIGESIHGAMGAASMMLVKALARELAPRKIRVNCLNLTLTSGTESFDDVFSGDRWDRKIFEKALRRFPFGRAPTAEEVAAVVAFLASPTSAQITGQTISVNGGLSFGGW